MGDINGDGDNDLLIGAFAYPAGAGKGRSYLVFGGRVGGSGDILLSSLNGTNGFKLDGENNRDGSGWSVSGAGDVNGDGYADLLIDAYGYFNSTCKGRSYVVFGGPGVGGGGDILLSGLNGANGFKLDGENDSDDSGYSVSAAGDFNGDGYADIVIGAFGYPAGSGKGRSYVVFGGPGVGGSGDILLSSLNGTNGFKLDGENNRDESGSSVSTAGDVNGDGIADLLIGAVSYPAGSTKGRSYVVFGDVSPQLRVNQLVINQGQSLILSQQNMNATDNSPSSWLNFTVTNVTNGYFALVNNPAHAITGFTQSSVWAHQIEFVHNNSLYPPGYDLQVINPGIALSPPPEAVKVTFYRRPVLSVNSFSVMRNGSVLMTPQQLSASDDYPNAQVFFIVQTAHGQFETVSAPGVPLVNFTQQQVVSGVIQFHQDGSIAAPSYNVTVSDPYFTVGPVSRYINYQFIPFPPLVDQPILPEIFTPGQPFEFSIPSDTFIDQNAEPLTLSATLADGEAFPTGISYDPSSATFSGVINQPESYNISVTATDSYGVSATTYFLLQITGSQTSSLLGDVKTAASVASSVGSVLLAGLAFLYTRYRNKNKREFENPFANEIHQRLKLSYSDFFNGEGKQYADAVHKMARLLQDKSGVSLNTLRSSDPGRYYYYADLFAEVIRKRVAMISVHCGTSYELRLTELNEHSEQILNEVIIHVSRASETTIQGAGQRGWCAFFSSCCSSSRRKLSDVELADMKADSPPLLA